MNKRYFKCNKCGQKMFIDSEEFLEFLEKEKSYIIPCTAKAEYRTSGICGGAYNEISEQEFNKK